VPLQAVEVALGTAHTCALLPSGEVACWGDGSYGQLGDGNSGTGYHRVVGAKVPGVTGATAVRAGGNTTCAIVASGVLCWGDGSYGQLGDTSSGPGHISAVPVAVHGLATVTDLAVSGTTACAALPDGTVRCWGENSAGEWLGFASADCGPYPISSALVDVPCQTTPKGVTGAPAATAVGAGGEHCCALATDGTASCWGSDDFGQLGDGNSGPTAHSSSPVLAEGVTGAVRIALGASHTCAIMGSTRTAACWGDNDYGQLGIGKAAVNSFIAEVTSVPGLDGMLDLDAALRVTCAVLADGTVSCWGDTSDLFEGADAGATAVLPTSVPGVSGAVSVRTSGMHACARHADMSVVCWGSNDSGQLGNGTVGLGDYSLAPVAPPGP
jgi:alpha-tubulin suppressor-like RCC1 family protein